MDLFSQTFEKFSYDLFSNKLMLLLYKEGLTL